MTYRAYLEHLLDVVIEKSETYFSIGEEAGGKFVPLEGAYSDRLKKAQDECQLAKTKYYAFLSFLEMNQVILDDHMPD